MTPCIQAEVTIDYGKEDSSVNKLAIIATTAFIVTLLNIGVFYLTSSVRYVKGDTEDTSFYLEHYQEIEESLRRPTYEWFELGGCVPNEKAAAEIAAAIFKATLGKKYTERPLRVIYDDENSLWHVSTQSKGVWVGASHVAIRKDNAEVVAIWRDKG